jgi:hypothetical protein
VTISQNARYAIPLIILGGLLLAGVIVASAVVVVQRRQRELGEAFSASQAEPASPPLVGAENWGNDLTTMNALLHLTAEQPAVDTTDTGKRIQVTRSHVDDTLVTLANGDKALLADARDRADKTSPIDLGGLWALLDAEDYLQKAEARATAETLALHLALVAA